MTVYNILDYGAVADGITNSAAAIQKAVDVCSVQGGGPHIKRWKKQKSKYSWNFIAAKPFGESLAYSRSP